MLNILFNLYLSVAVNGFVLLSFKFAIQVHTNVNQSLCKEVSYILTLHVVLLATRYIDVYWFFSDQLKTFGGSSRMLIITSWITGK